MSWFHMILRAYGLPVKRPLAAVQQLVINNGADPQSLDPHKTTGSPEQQIIGELLEGLFIFNREGEVVPGMALHAYSPDKKSWSFNIRRGAKWSNGDLLDARDFVYSWRRLADPATASPKVSVLQMMNIANIEEILAGRLPPEALGIEAIGPLTLRITLAQPLGFLKKLLATTGLMPVPRATIEKYGDHWTHPEHWVGNGAYSLKERVVNEKVVLARNPHYWDNSQTAIDQVTYLSLDEEAELARYRTGRLDLTYSRVSFNLLKNSKHEFPNELKKFKIAGFSGYQINTQIPPFNDASVRKALNLIIDRRALLQQLPILEPQPAYNVVPDGLGGLTAYQPSWLAWSAEQRRETAQKLLQAAGYGPKNPLKFTLLYPASEMNKQLALMVSALWQAHLPVEITLGNREWKVFLEESRSGNYQIAHLGSTVSYGDPYGLLVDFSSPCSCNETGYSNPAFDACLAKAAKCLYDAERWPHYRQAEALLAEEVPVIPLFHFVVGRLVKPYLEGLSDRNLMDLFYTKDLYITKHPLAPKKARS